MRSAWWWIDVTLHTRPLLTGKTQVSPRDTILVNKNLLVHKQWKYVTPGQGMMEASWGGQ